ERAAATSSTRAGRRARSSASSALRAWKPTAVIGIWAPRSLDFAIDPSYRDAMAVNLAAFLGVSILVIVTPGQDTALTIRNTLLGGRRPGVLTAAGVASGQFIWTVATSAGLATLLTVGLLFNVMTLTWLTGYALVVALVGDVLRRERVRRSMEAITGLVLLGLGLRLATERR